MDKGEEVMNEYILDKINNIVLSTIILHISSANLDSCARVVIPMEIRKYLNQEKLSSIEFWVEKKIIHARVKSLDQKKLEQYSSTRKLDELGRVVIPIEFRKKLDIQVSDTISICLGKDNIIRITKSL